jgi:hypothetical protein
MDPLKNKFRLISLATAVVMLISSGKLFSVRKTSAKELTEASTAVLYGKCKGKRMRIE